MLKKLGKLLKYEFRFYFRILLPTYLLTILIAIVIRLQGLPMETYYERGNGLMTILFSVLITAMSVITIILIIQRYTDNFLKDPGSLMFSLPVSVWALLASKVIAALCMVLLGFLSVIVSLMINSIGTENWNTITRIFIPDNPKDIVLYATSGFSMFLQQICLFYAAITVSYMLPRFRNQAAFAMYFLVMFLMSYILRIAEKIEGSTMPFIFTSLTSFVFAAGFFCITGFLLKRSYNLE